MSDESPDVVMLPNPEGSNKYSSAADMKQAQQKELMVEQLKKTPIIQVACEKLGVGRSSYYRWRQDDKDFAKNCDDAIKEGQSLVSDVAVSQLLNAIKTGNMTAIMFWLKSFDSNFRTKVEVSGSVKQVREELTEEEVILFVESLKLLGYSERQINIKVPDNNVSDQETDTNAKFREDPVPDRPDQAQ